MAFKKLFTLQEANSFVPQLLKLVPLIQKLSTSLHNDFPDIKNAREKAKWSGGSEHGVEYLNAVFKYNNVRIYNLIAHLSIKNPPDFKYQKYLKLEFKIKFPNSP